MKTCVMLAGIISALIIGTPLQAAYVTPKIGGGQYGGFPMIMPEIFFDGESIYVFDEDGYPWSTLAWSTAPILRPLVPPAAFDPTKPWAVLIGKAYNFQYGWDSAFLDEYTYPFPPGSAVWIQVLKQTPELETYYKDGGYAPIFGTPYANGNPSPDIWWWNKGMRHNVYAVPEDFYGRLSADYKVYLGNASTGAELVNGNGQPLYGSAFVTLRWLRPCPYILEGDLNVDCIVNLSDFNLLAAKWLDSTCYNPDWCEESDIDHSGTVDMSDAALLTENWLIDCFATPDDPECFTRPGPL
jgi:hypothetical protein